MDKPILSSSADSAARPTGGEELEQESLHQDVQQEGAVEVLRERERQLHEVQRLAHLGSWSWDVKSDRVTWSDEMFRIYGLSPSEDRTIAFEDFVARLHPEDRDTVLDVVARARQEPQPFQFQHRVVRPDGSVRILQARGEVVADGDGSSRMFGTGQDITELKEAEEALRVSEASYRTIFELASDAIFVHDIETGAILDANRKACELHGCTLDELKELGIGGISDGRPPFDAEHAWVYIRRAAEGEPQLFEWLVRNQTGERIWVEVSLHRVPILGEDRVLASVRNITERKSAEAALQRAYDELERRVEERTAELARADQRFRAIVEASPTPLLLSSLSNGTILYANDRLETLIGVAPGSLVGQKTPDFYYDPKDRPRVLETLQHDGYVRDLELRVRRADGTPRWASLSVQQLVFNGEPALATALIDITERKEAEEALRKSEEHFRSLIQNASDLITIMDADGTVRFQSEAIRRLFGYEPEELLGHNAFDYVHPSDVPPTLERFQRVLEQPGLTEAVQFRFRHKDGSWRHVEAAGRTLSATSAAEGVVVNSRDITERKRFEEALQESEERFRSLIENAHDITCIVDTAGVMLYQSPSLHRILGWEPEEIMGRSAFDFIHPDDVAEVIETLGRIAAHPGTTGAAEYRFRHKDGSWRLLEAFGRTLSLASADEGIVANIRDITERKQAEETLRLQKTLLEAQGEASIDGILVVAGEGRMLSFNRRFVEMWNIPPEVIAAQSDEAAIQAVLDQLQDPAAFQARVVYLYEHPDEESRDEICLRDGRVFDRYSAPVRSKEGDYYGRIWFFRDITERKRFEEALEAAKEEAERASRAKSHFLANMSHELRTPLNAIIGYAEMMAEEAEDAELGHIVPDLEKIQAAGRHLLRLINDVLDLSKVEAGRMEVYLEDFEVAPLLENVQSMIQPLIEEKGNRLIVEEDGELGRMHSDLMKVRQMLFNLLSNAAKFTDSGTITLAAERRREDASEWLVFRISDTGIGMSGEQVARLFQPFTQADASTTRRYGGTGLGLTITRRFTEMLGGTIDVESEPGVGTTFTLRLPAISDESGVDARRAPSPADRPSIPVSSEAEGAEDGAPLVLVIDDDDASCEVACRTLMKEGVRVTYAYSGEEGLRKAQEEAPDLIILDVLMPGVSGWEVLARLKADPETAEIPVVIVTVLSNQRLGYALGANDYLTKPVDRERLLQTVRRHLGGGPPAGDLRPILLVEADPAVREGLRQGLEEEGWPVIEAENGRRALEAVAEAVPALVILDLTLSETDGFAFIGHLRAHPEWDNLPVLVLTAQALSEEDRHRLNGFVEEVIQKGEARPADLLPEVRRLLKRRARRTA